MMRDKMYLKCDHTDMCRGIDGLASVVLEELGLKVCDEKAMFIDEDKLSKNTEFYGYYQILTSELELSELEVIEKYHGLSQIENQFRIMKDTIETRPMYVQKRERIEAHLTINIISLIMMRLIQHMIKKNPDVSTMSLS